MRWPTHQPELLLAQYQAQLPSFYFPKAVLFNLCAFWHAAPAAKLQRQYGIVSTQHWFGRHHVYVELINSMLQHCSLSVPFTLLLPLMTKAPC